MNADQKHYAQLALDRIAAKLSFHPGAEFAVKSELTFLRLLLKSAKPKRNPSRKQ